MRFEFLDDKGPLRPFRIITKYQILPVIGSVRVRRTHGSPPPLKKTKT